MKLPEDKVVFIGDAVLKNQPPFLAGANLKPWLASLEILLDTAYKGYTFISSRGGIVSTTVIKNQYDFLKHVHDKLDKITAKKVNPAAIEKLVATLLTSFKDPAARQKQFAQRLRYGLLHYNSRPSHVSGQFNDSQ